MDESLVILFVFGAFTIWNSSTKYVKYIRELIKPYEISPQKESDIKRDDMLYRYKSSNNKLQCYGNTFIQDTEDDDIKVTISYGWSQTLSLQYFIQQLEPLTLEMRDQAVHNQKFYSRFIMKRKEFYKLIGRLYLIKYHVNLNSDVQDEFDYKLIKIDTSDYYHIISHYYNIPERIDSVNQKQEILTDLSGVISEKRQNEKMVLLDYFQLSLLILLIVLDVFWNIFVHRLKLFVYI